MVEQYINYYPETKRGGIIIYILDHKSTVIKRPNTRVTPVEGLQFINEIHDEIIGQIEVSSCENSLNRRLIKVKYLMHYSVVIFMPGLR